VIVYTEPRGAGHIPVIDLEPSFSADEASCTAVASRIGVACRDTGFFYVSNHGVKREVVRAAFEQAARFFDRPLNWKSQYLKVPGTYGYEPSEALHLDNASPGDLNESFNCSVTESPDAQDSVTNKWPSDIVGFRENIEAYSTAMISLGLHISRLLARSLDLSPHYFDEALKHPTAALRLLRYPPQPSVTEFNQLGAGAHTDFGWITLLAQDDCGGLEVQTAAGDWIRAEPIEDTFVVNLGDLVPRWTNGLYHSNMHRVLNNRSGRNRHSIAQFYNVAYATRIECLPTCIREGEVARFTPCTAGEHRMQRLKDAVRDPKKMTT